jgi:hypothetical protein
MNKTKIAILSSILMLSLSFLFSSSFAGDSELGGGRISLVQGQVLIQIKDVGEWTEASVNFPIADGDRIVTERDGRVELQFKNGTYVRVGEISQLDIIALGFDQGKAFIHLNQLEGKIYVNHRPITEEISSLYLDLPYGVVSSYVPSRFRVDLASSEARISVLEGSVEFKSNGRPIPLAQGKTLIAREGGFAEVGPLYGRDEWDRWNEARDDEFLQRRYAQKYLSPDLEPYGYEMEGNGRWVYTPEYQYVWVPTVAVGWAPFQYGYWAWRRGIYCWVPREPWGWVPFHYGRWIHMRNYGWAWVPPFRHAAIWNPGAVAWNIGTTYVSWVPLAPGEIYYGHGYYGPQSVNINRVNVTIQKNAYINAQVKDAVVTIYKDSFFRKNPVRITQVASPFQTATKVSGPPIEKPVFSEGKKAPSRLIKESVGKVQPERKPLTTVERDPKVIEQKQIPGSPDKRPISETTQNRVVGAVQSNRKINSSQGNSVKKDSTPIPTGERVNTVRNSSRFDSKPSRELNTAGIILKSNPTSEQRGIISNGVKGETKVLNQEGNKNRNVPVIPPVTAKTLNAKEPQNSKAVTERNAPRTMNQDRYGKMEQFNSNKEGFGQRNLISPSQNDVTKVKSPNPVAQSPQRNTSININQNPSVRTVQPNAQPSRPSQVQPLSQSQQGKAFVGRPSLPDVKSSPAPVSKGQAVQSNRGSTGGILGASPLGSFR